MIKLEQIKQAIIDEVKNIESLENKRKEENADTFFGLVPLKNINIDYGYLNNNIDDVLKFDIFKLPSKEDNIKKFAKDFVDTFIFDMYSEDLIINKNNNFSNLKIFIDNLEDGEIPVINYYSAYFDQNESSSQTSENFIKTEKRIINDNIVKNFSWIKPFVNINLKINLENKGLENSEEKMSGLFFELTKKFGKLNYGYKLNEITTSLMQQEADEYETRYLHSETTLRILSYLDNIVKENGGKLLFSELKESIHPDTYKDIKTRWSFEQLVKANTKVEELAHTIEENKLTPFEATLFICAWTKNNIEYYETQDREITNTIVSAINTHKLRCVGFSEFVNTVLHLVNFNYLDSQDNNYDLDAKKISVSLEPEGEYPTADHCQSLIYIKDKKYGIDGDYICDINFDNQLGLNKILGEEKYKLFKPFNIFYLKNLSEYKSLYPNYTIYPYLTKDFSECHYDYDEYNKLVYYIEGIPATKYYKKSDEIMDKIQKEEGSSISYSTYNEAYKKIIPLVYNDMSTKITDTISNSLEKFNGLIDNMMNQINSAEL